MVHTTVTDDAQVALAREEYRAGRDAKVQAMADAARARKTKPAAVRPTVPVTRALGLSTSEYVVTYCKGGEILRTEHADAAGAAQRVVTLAARGGVLYSDAERLDLSEALRMHLTRYVWDDVRASADAHYTLTVEYLGGAL